MPFWPPHTWLDANEDPPGPVRQRPMFSIAKAVHAVRFIETLCTHTKGKWAGKPFILLHWQRYATMMAFGTVRSDGGRQYRVVWLEIPKKNGKSELAAAWGLLLLTGDGEFGAEVYSAAVDRKQAGLVHQVATQMVRNNKALRKKLKIIDSVKRIVRHDRNSFYEVLSSEVGSKHGLNPSGVLFDEIHAQPNRSLWDVLTEGTEVARFQQLVLVLTTAGICRKGDIGWEMHQYAVRVRDGIIDDPRFLPIIYGASAPKIAEKDDDPTPDEGDATSPDVPQWYEDRDLWRRVNPSLGHIFSMQMIEDHYNEVRQNPARLHNFWRFRLNVWVNQVDQYIPMEAWDRCGDLPIPTDEALRGRKCWGGLDLSSTTDLASFGLAWEPDVDGIIPVRVWCWLPGVDIEGRSRRDNAPYLQWVRDGHLVATGGNVVDYAFIRSQINAAAGSYSIQEIAYDPWNATQLALQLQDEDGMTMVEHRQGYKSMSPPTKELHKLVLDTKLSHSGHPVLRWCVDNLTVTTDAAENVKPDKAKSKNRIDCVVAVINALGRLMLNSDNKISVYQNQGLVVL